MMMWFFGGIALGAAVAATVIRDIRRAVLLLWLAGMACGCIFLSCESEILAVTQWSVSTLVCFALLYFTLLLGGHRSHGYEVKLIPILAIPVSVGFGIVIFLAAPPIESFVQPPRSDLHAFAQILAKNQVVSVEVLALTLLAVIVGAGVLGRPNDAGSGGVS